MKITARDIVYSTRMSGRPEFYSGRPPMSCDLNGEKLSKIHSAIKEKIGEKQAESFVTMIENLSNLSATNFLNSLYSLEANNWEYVPTSEGNIDVGPDGPQRGAIAFATIFAVPASMEGWDETDYIRNTFFNMIGHKIKKSEERDIFGYTTDDYSC